MCIYSVCNVLGSAVWTNKINFGEITRQEYYTIAALQMNATILLLRYRRLCGSYGGKHALEPEKLFACIRAEIKNFMLDKYEAIYKEEEIQNLLNNTKYIQYDNFREYFEQLNLEVKKAFEKESKVICEKNVAESRLYLKSPIVLSF